MWMTPTDDSRTEGKHLLDNRFGGVAGGGGGGEGTPIGSPKIRPPCPIRPQCERSLKPRPDAAAVDCNWQILRELGRVFATTTLNLGSCVRIN